MILRRIIWGALCAIGIHASGEVFASENLPSGDLSTNFAILQQLTQNMVEEVFNTTYLKDARILQIKNTTSNIDGEWLVKKTILDEAEERGIQVVELSTPIISDSLSVSERHRYPLLQFNVMRLGIEYARQTRGLFHGDLVRREFMVESFFVIVQDDGTVVWKGTINKNWNDTCPPALISTLEIPRYGFTTAQLPAGLSNNKILESLIAVAATSFILYLFYSYRTD